jgi:hypothetical protein
MHQSTSVITGLFQYFKYFLIICLLGFASVSLAETVLENDNIRITVGDQGAISFLDKAHNNSWGNSFVGWVNLINQEGQGEKISLSTSEVSFKSFSDSALISFDGIRGERLQDSSFLMIVKLSLEEKGFLLELRKLQTTLQLEDVEYPAHIFNVNSGVPDGYIVAPHLQGILIPSRYDAGFMRYGQNIWDLIADQERWLTLESGNLNMPWFGASLNNSSVMAMVETSSDCVLHLIGNSLVGEEGFTEDDSRGQVPGTRISSLTPIWKSSQRELAYARKMRIELVENGYVGMAKRYKEEAKQSGRFVTLKEKIADNPEVAKIIGAPDLKIYIYTNRKNTPKLRAWSGPVLNGYSHVHTTFDQVAEISDDLSEMGVEKTMILLGGWNRMGYDREHVDMWPPAEGAGGIDGLQQACSQVKDHGYLFALHDNYNDFYPDAPSYDQKYIIKREDGSIGLGGVWDGGLTHHIATSAIEELLNRNLQRIEEHIPLNAYYFDVITNTSHEENYDPDNLMTRRQDLAYRKELLKNVQDRGLVVGGERGTDWALPVVSFCEGLQGGGGDYHRGVGYRLGLTVPLFYLVYRECVVGYWQHGTPYGREDHANHVLLDVLYGQPSSWSLVYNQWEDLKPLFKETYDLLGRLHQKTAHFAMTDHQYLTDDYMVQRSEFSDGTVVYVNFGITTYESEFFSVPPKGFRLDAAGEQPKVATVGRKIEYQ